MIAPTTPNMAIIRIPDENGEKTFVEIPIIEGIVSSSGSVFTLENEDDSYNDMGFEHVILAVSVEGGSIDLARYAVDDTNGNPAEVGKFNNVTDCVAEIYNAYMSLPSRTLQ